MAWQSISSTEIAVGKPETNTLWTKVKDSLDFLYGSVGAVAAASNLANGSFEVDSDSDGTPDNWTMTAYSGGTAAIETTIRSHGDQCIKFVHPGGGGNGGGHIVSDYVTVSTLYANTVAFDYYCTVAGMKVMLQVKWYDEAESLLATETHYTSTSNPTAWATRVITNIPTYSGAYSAKFDLIFGYTDTDPGESCTAYCDNVRFAAPYSSVPIVGAATNSGEAATLYAPIFGGILSSAATAVQTNWPRTGYFRNMYGRANANVTLTLRVRSSDSILSVAATAISTAYVSVTANDLVDMKFVDSNGAVSGAWALEFLEI